MLDVVDASDHIIGQQERGEVHRQGLMHRACHIVLFNTAGQVFVQQRSRHKDVNPGLWDTSAAGHVEAGESYAQCAVRELAEELGVELAESALEILHRMPPAPDNGMEHIAVYRVVSDQSLTLQADEIADGRWLSAAELEHWMQSDPERFTTVFRDIWHTVTAQSTPSAGETP